MTTEKRPWGLLAVATLAAVLPLLAGCATTRLASEWRDAELAPVGYRTWLVMAAMPDPVKRRQWEDAFTQAVAARGVSATPSYRLFPGTFPDTAEARAKLREGGFDGLLVVRKGAEDETAPQRPGSSGASVGVGGTFVPFWGVYVSVFHQLARSGAAASERVVRWDVEVWEGGGEGRMVWAGRSAMEPAGPPETMSRELAGAVVPRLQRARLLR